MVEFRRIFLGPEGNEFMHGYDAAYEEINTTIKQGDAHTHECVDCPPCEILRAAARAMVNRLRGSMSEAEFAIVEGILLKNIEGADGDPRQ